MQVMLEQDAISAISQSMKYPSGYRVKRTKNGLIIGAILEYGQVVIDAKRDEDAKITYLNTNGSMTQFFIDRKKASLIVKHWREISRRTRLPIPLLNMRR